MFVCLYLLLLFGTFVLFAHHALASVRLFWMTVFLKWGANSPENGWGWKRPLELILSNGSAQSGSPKAGCPGPHPDGFSVSQKMGDHHWDQQIPKKKAFKTNKQDHLVHWRNNKANSSTTISWSHADLVVGDPTCSRGVGTRWPLRTLPTKAILWYYKILPLNKLKA